MNRKVLSSLMAIMVLVVSASVTSAWSADYYWSHTAGTNLTVTYKWGDRLGNPTYLWQQAFEAGLPQWEAGTRIDFVYNSSSANILNTYDADDGNWGICNRWVYSDGKLARFTAMGNVHTTSGITNNERQYTATHELGHGLGMGHSTETAVMNIAVNRDVIYVTQMDDINGIKAMYP